MSNVKHCWPTPWLEAAMRAGFAHYKGDGEWEFVSDKMRDKLAEFGAAVQAAERERCAKVCEEEAQRRMDAAHKNHGNGSPAYGRQMAGVNAANNCAAAIRAGR